MPIRLLLLAAMLFALGGCASNLNPLNWFSGGTDDGVVLEPAGGWGADQDARPLIAQVTEFTVLRNPEGAILQVAGLAPRQGYWNGELVPENDERPENGVLSYAFRISEPPVAARQGPPGSRRILVAKFVSAARLEGVRSIRILGAGNSMTARR